MKTILLFLFAMVMIFLGIASAIYAGNLLFTAAAFFTAFEAAHAADVADDRY